jgi:hypothetical protein
MFTVAAGAIYWVAAARWGEGEFNKSKPNFAAVHIHFWLQGGPDVLLFTLGYRLYVFSWKMFNQYVTANTPH